jgi:hypothetical protein
MAAPSQEIPHVFDAQTNPFGNKTAMPQMTWRYKVDIQLSSVLMQNLAAYKNIYTLARSKAAGDSLYTVATCPLTILEGMLNNATMTKGYGRWQCIEFDEVVISQNHSWNVGNTKIDFPLYERPERTLNLHSLESTGGWIKRLALCLRDCAMDRETGKYYPYECRMPLDIYLTTFGFKQSYNKRYVYLQCGLQEDAPKDLAYNKDEKLDNILVFKYRNFELRDVDPVKYSTP